MPELTCDDCGTIDDFEADACELCGASLEEEERRYRWLVGPFAWGGLALLINTGVAFFILMSIMHRSRRERLRDEAMFEGYTSFSHALFDSAILACVLTTLGFAGWYVWTRWFQDEEKPI